MKRRYRVVLPVEIAGRIYQFGEIAELDLETAIGLSHALIEIEEKEMENGRNSEGH